MRDDDLSMAHALRLLCQESRKQAARWASDVATDGIALASKAPWPLTMGVVCGLLAVFGVALLPNADSRLTGTSTTSVPTHSASRPLATQSQASPSTAVSAGPGESGERAVPVEQRQEGAPPEAEPEQRPGVTREELESQPDGSC
jgi:hypothetical protein